MAQEQTRQSESMVTTTLWIAASLVVVLVVAVYMAM
jgi:hypothetical protein